MEDISEARARQKLKDATYIACEYFLQKLSHSRYPDSAISSFNKKYSGFYRVKQKGRKLIFIDYTYSGVNLSSLLK